MLRTYEKKFLHNGRQIFVPSAAGRLVGEAVHDSVWSRWRKPEFYYHLRSGGHVAALERHLRGHVFAMLDISGFFDSVTRSKIHRSLRDIGFPHREAWEIAQEATVKKANGRFSLPYGFVQSPVLASLALDQSALGRTMRTIAKSRHARLTSYMDDIIISGDAEPEVARARADLVEAAARARFEINVKKSQPPGRTITAFNIILSHGSLSITHDRMSQFETGARSEEEAAVVGLVSYVRGINDLQGDRLLTIGERSPHASVRARIAKLMAISGRP